METDILEGPIGNKGSYDVEFKGGKLVAKVDYEVIEGVKGALSIELGAEAVLNALKKAIPGEIDDTVIDIIKNALMKS